MCAPMSFRVPRLCAGAPEGCSDGSRIIGEDPALGAPKLLGLRRNQRPGVEPRGGKQRDALIISGLVARVFPVADQKHAAIEVEIRSFDPANLVEPHRRGHCKLHDPCHWQS